MDHQRRPAGEVAEELAEAGVDRVTVSLDSIDPDVFRLMNGVGLPVESVLEGIEAAVRAGLGPIKLNAVIRRGLNDGGICGAGYLCPATTVTPSASSSTWTWGRAMAGICRRWSPLPKLSP